MRLLVPALVSTVLASVGVLAVGEASAQRQDAATDAAPAIRTGDINRIEVEPNHVELTGPFSYQQLLVTGWTDEGEQIDLTREAVFQLEQSLVQISTSGLVQGSHDGATDAIVSAAGQRVQLPIHVDGLGTTDPPDFLRDIMPVLSRVGCNAGTCHGSQAGKNGFKLSLRGYDPLQDHRALTDDLAARRVNLSAPRRSLMLLKPAGIVPHEGGAVLRPDDRYYNLLCRWIAGGAKLAAESGRVSRIEIKPESIVISKPSMLQQVRVVATLEDGSKRDVTREAFIESSDIEVLQTKPHGLLSALRRGESAVIVRYEGQYDAVPVVVMGDRAGFQWNHPPSFNYIDQIVYQKQRQVKVLPGDVCSDAEFIRRVYLDLTGLPPTVDQVRKFLADDRAEKTKRDQLIDQLIGSEAFVEHWTGKWADLLQLNSKFLGDDGAVVLRKWIRAQLAKNTAYDRFVREILTARGSNLDNPPAAYFKILRAPGDVMENTTQVFLGIRFNCNKCHDHPFERWTQDDYYHLAAYFARLERTEDKRYEGKKIGGSAVDEEMPLVEVISDIPTGEMIHERTGKIASPAFPYDFDHEPLEGARREQFAAWLTSANNPYFARSFVNRLWSYLLGVGLIEPVDDIRAGNPPTNPALLEAMAERFVADQFDVNALIASICKSRTYQLSIRTGPWNQDDKVNYSHAMARRLPAEVLYDAVHQVTGSTRRLPKLQVGRRAAEVVDPSAKLADNFLDLFGRPPRQSACECDRRDDILLGAVMNLVMGSTLNNAIIDPDNDIARLVGEQSDDRKVVERLFLAILNRPATTTEIAVGVAAMRENLAQAELAGLLRKLNDLKDRISPLQHAWEQALLPPDWHVLVPAKITSSAGAEFEVADDKSIRVTGPLGKDTYSLTIENALKNITAFRLEVLTDESLPGGGPGRAKNGNFVLNQFLVRPGTGEPLVLQNAQADYSQKNYDVQMAIDDDVSTGWAIRPKTGKKHVIIFETSRDVT
ncbi:MAG TPA: DUF1549 and DUF1553 domain-containing protein, partial [Pirellulales bacterium]|nr:DUF1549 and DUF1553 domain-containing protein [Pirellulales bacterium]